MADDASRLPLEIYHVVLAKLPCARHDDASVRTLARCARTSRAVRAVATSGLLWAAHYKARYTHHDSRVDRVRQTKHAGDWYAMYCLHRSFDRNALSMLDDMERFEGGTDRRHEHMSEIINVYS
jgi:hypothetical protein